MKTIGPEPPERSNHTCVVCGDSIIVFGGRGTNGRLFNDAYELALGNETVEFEC